MSSAISVEERRGSVRRNGEVLIKLLQQKIDTLPKFWAAYLPSQVRWGYPTGEEGTVVPICPVQYGMERLGYGLDRLQSAQKCFLWRRGLGIFAEVVNSVYFHSARSNIHTCTQTQSGYSRIRNSASPSAEDARWTRNVDFEVRVNTEDGISDVNPREPFAVLPSCWES
jgi:hypothetical protein